MMEASAVGEVLRQIRDGRDIPAPARLLSNITPEKAAQELPGRPYSILTNLNHALFWQDLWLHKLQGKRTASFTEDWVTPPANEWKEIRARFLAGLDQAIAISESDPFAHRMKSDEVAVRALIQIAIHDAYHLGQINLLKRELCLSRKP